MTRLGPRLARAAAALMLLSAGLAGCGNGPDTGFAGGDLLKMAGGALKPAPRAGTGGVAVIDIPAETLASWPEPLISAAVENTRTSAALGRIARNGADETYASHTGNQITLRGGLVVATRGLGADLMSAAVPSRAAIASGRGTHTRAWQWLDGLDQVVSVTMTCTLGTGPGDTVVLSGRSWPTRLVTEACTGPGGAQAVNLYWVDQGGVARRSRQWLGQDAGYLLLFDPNPRKF